MLKICLLQIGDIRFNKLECAYILKCAFVTGDCEVKLLFIASEDALGVISQVLYLNSSAFSLYKSKSTLWLQRIRHTLTPSKHDNTPSLASHTGYVMVLLKPGCLVFYFWTNVQLSLTTNACLCVNF